MPTNSCDAELLIPSGGVCPAGEVLAGDTEVVRLGVVERRGVVSMRAAFTLRAASDKPN